MKRRFFGSQSMMFRTDETDPKQWRLEEFYFDRVAWLFETLLRVYRADEQPSLLRTGCHDGDILNAAIELEDRLSSYITYRVPNAADRIWPEGSSCWDNVRQPAEELKRLRSAISGAQEQKELLAAWCGASRQVRHMVILASDESVPVLMRLMPQKRGILSAIETLTARQRRGRVRDVEMDNLVRNIAQMHERLSPRAHYSTGNSERRSGPVIELYEALRNRFDIDLPTDQNISRLKRVLKKPSGRAKVG